MNKREAARIRALKRLLPKELHVQVFKTHMPRGVRITIAELSHCYTQAKNTDELEIMVTDLVFTHFEIPHEYICELGEYVLR